MLLTDGCEGGEKRSPFPKICHTYPKVMNLAQLYLNNIQQVFEPRGTPAVSRNTDGDRILIHIF